MSVRIEANAEPLPGYTLIERIGGGGFGVVWKARAPGGLLKAIKFVSADLNGLGDTGGQRAEQELKALKRVKDVRHPYILSLERIEEDTDGQLIIVMELAERNLAELFKEHKEKGRQGIPREELLRYMEETAEALDLMNTTYQLQHLDIKPQNLFVMFNHVKVADFGLVKYLEGAQASVTGGVTPVYAAPETFDGVVTRFSDQYSLAIVYQELLTGKRPFAGTSIRQLIVQHLQGTPDVSPLPEADRPVIMRALAKVPEERFPSCGDMVRLLRENSSPPGVEVHGPAVLPPSPSFPKPNTACRDEPNETPSALLETGMMRGSERGRGAYNGATTPPPQGGQEIVLEPRDTPAAVEFRSDGVLFPALVIGVGQVGLTVLQALRGQLCQRFGSARRLPTLRLLQLDTDPEVVRTATRGSSATALSATEVLLAELNRPSHYLKPREGQLPLDKWMNPRMLYRIPRSQMTTGIRALGRLAFCDNYRAIVNRLQSELKACSDLSALKKAARETGLGLRTNRPRVYVVAGLAGGTGGGMFLDLAYTVRDQLKRLGHEQPEVVGVFFLPPVDPARTRTMALGNAFAALTELQHFGTPGVTFQARYHDQLPAITDASAPFDRCVLLPLPDESDEHAVRELTDLASQALCRDLCSPLGRKLDELRATESGPTGTDVTQRYQTFGLYQLVWPRRTLLQQAGRRICLHLVQRWLSKDSKPVRDLVRDWVQERWQSEELAADHFIARVRQTAEKSLGRTTDSAFLDVLTPLIRKCTPPPPSKTRQKPPPPPEVTPDEVREVFDKLLAMVGKPEDDHTSDQPAALVKVLRDAATELGTQWEQKLAAVPILLIEDPHFRLAGAEEAVRQVTVSIEQVLQHHEPLAKELTNHAAEAYERLQAYIAPKPGTRRPALSALDLLELLRSYPKWRFQSVVLQQLANAFLRLRGHLSDDLREINFCRVRLAELQRLFEAPPEAVAATENAALPRAGRCLFPSGCTNLNEALEQYLNCLTPEAYLEADALIEEALKHEYKALAHICLTPANILKKVEALMLETAEAFAGEKLAEIEVGDMYVSQFAYDAQVTDDLASCFEEAVPLFTPADADPAKELHVLAAPPGPATDQLRLLATQALPDVTVHAADSFDDIVMYREFPSIALADLEQFGAAAQDAYRVMRATENFTPHTRIDVQFP